MQENIDQIDSIIETIEDGENEMLGNVIHFERDVDALERTKPND